MSMPSPQAALIDAVLLYTLSVAGEGATAVSIKMPSGAVLHLDFPPGCRAPARGWAVVGGQTHLDGRPVRITGKPADVLRVIVEAGGEIVSEQLKRSVWDPHTDDRTVQNAVSQVRKILRELLGVAFDPLPATEDGYRLAAG